MNRPEVHDVLRRWRALADAQDPQRVLVGETYVLDLDSLIPFYGEDADELHLAFNFLFVHCELEADALRSVVEGMEEKLPAASWPVYTGSNHDAGRLTTRWAGNDVRRARAALLMLLTLRGTPFLYYGDELALPDVPLDAETALDPVRGGPATRRDNRDVCRTPMPWADEPGGGFTTAAATPWLPFGDVAACNVAAQREDPGSVLHLVRDLIALRKRHAELTPVPTRRCPRRREHGRGGAASASSVALNLSGAEVELEGVAGRVAVATDRARDGEALAGRCAAGPYEGVVADLAEA